MGVGLTYWDADLDRPRPSFIIVLYGEAGYSTRPIVGGSTLSFNKAVKETVIKGLEQYEERVTCIGDFNSLVSVRLDGMGLSGGVSTEGSLVSMLLHAGIVDGFRELHPTMTAVSCSSAGSGAHSRIDCMMCGSGVSITGMAHIMDAVGPHSDHALMLADYGGMNTGSLYCDEGEGISIKDLKG